MKNNFQSKSVPRGTRTIWRYLGALFILFTFAVGNVWGANVPAAAGTYSVVGKKPGNANRFYKLGNGVYIHRINNSSWDSSMGMKIPSDNQNGVAVYLSSSMKVSALINKKSDKNAVNVELKAYPITNGSTTFDAFEAGSDNSTEITVTRSSTASYTLSTSFAKLDSKAAENKSTNEVTFAAGYYYIVGTDDASTTYLTSITLTAASSDPVDPTITFDNGAYTLGATALDLSSLFTSNSKGTVTYSVKTDGKTNATIDGTNFSATAAGTCVVTASQAAETGKYNAKAVDANIVVSAPAATHSVTPATEDISKGTAAAAATTVAEGATTTITATPLAGYVFDHWVVSGAGATLSSTSTNPTTLTMGTADATVTAYFAEKTCPTSGEVFYMEITSTASSVNIAAQTTVELGTYGTFRGGSASITNGATETGKAYINNSAKTVSINGNAAYVTLNLDCPLKTGDQLTFVSGSGSNQICFTTDLTRSTSNITSGNKWTVPAAFNDVSTIYIWRNSSHTYIRSITITRPYNVTFVSDHGTAPTTPTKALSFTLTELSDASFTHTGWTADKAVKVGGETKAASTALAVDATVELTDNTTFTAVWEAKVTKHTVTYYDGEAIEANKLGSELINEGSNPTGAGLAPKKQGFTFGGWSLTNGGAAISAYTDVTVNEDKNLFAVWTPVVCPTSGTVFAFEMNESAKPGSEVKAPQKDILVIDEYLTITGQGSAIIGNTTNNANQYASVKTDPKINLSGATGYLQIALECALQAGDVITIAKNNTQIYISDEVGTSGPTGNKYTTATNAENTIVVGANETTAAWVGAMNLYFWYKGGGVNITSVSVTRPAKHTLAWNFDGGNTTSTTHTAAGQVVEGAAITYPANNTMSKDGYTFSGWSTDVTEMPTSDLTITALWTAWPTMTLNRGAAPSGDDENAGQFAPGATVEVPACPFSYTDYNFNGWAYSQAVTMVDETHFTMPSENLTLTAQWVDANNVAQIGEAKYTSLEAALEHAADGEIVLLQDINVEAQVEVLAGVTATLDLAGHKIEYTGSTTLTSGVILVHNGASLTINDSSDPDAGSIVSGDKAYAAVALTKLGDDASNPATLVVNGGALTGYYYGITGNGSRNNTVITINGGTITGTVGIAIYHPQVGTLTVNNGSLTGVDAAIEMRAGTLVINDGTFTATATEFSCNPNGSGSTTTGAAIAIAQHTTKKDIEVTINGGTFNGVKALNESNPHDNDPAPQVAMAITNGTFNGAVSTVDVNHFVSGGSFSEPVAEANCATDYYPATKPNGKYGVTEAAVSVDFAEEAAKTEGQKAWATFLADNHYDYNLGSGGEISWDKANTYDTGLKLKKSTANALYFTTEPDKVITLTVGNIAGMTIQINGGEAQPIASGTDATNLGVSTYYSANAQTVVLKETSGSSGYNMLKSINIRDPYTVSFDANGGDAVASLKATPAINLPSATNGTQNFAGWFTDADVFVGMDGDSYTPTEDITLVAHWEALSTVNTLSDLKVNGVTVDGFDPEVHTYNIVVPYGTAIADLPKITAATATNANATVNIYPSAGPEWTDDFGGCYRQQANVTPQDPNAAVGYNDIRITIGPKDPLCIIKAEHDGTATGATVTGYYGGTKDKKTANNGKLGVKDNYMGIKLAEEAGTFKAGDVLKIYATNPSAAVRIYSDKGTTRINATDGTFDSEKMFTYTLTDDEEWIYLYRLTDSESDMNPTLGYMAVYRSVPNPLVETITFNGAAGVIDNTASPKTITVEVPASTDIATMPVLANFYSNDPSQTSGAVTGGTWAEGDNEYIVTDKDNDQTVYAVTITKAVPSSDATLSALSYGTPATAITLADGVYDYDVLLPYGTSAVPALAATKNHAGATIEEIANAPAFVDRKATSTVTVKAEDDATEQVYKVNFTVDRFETTVLWDGSTMSSLSDITAMDVATADISVEGKSASFEGKNYTKALNFGGNTKSTRYFGIVVPEGKVAKVSVVYRSRGNSARSIIIGTAIAGTIDESAIVYATKENDTELLYKLTADIFAAGTIYINTTNGFQVFEIDVQLADGYGRSAMLGAGVLGTVCVPNNVAVEDIQGVTVYELMGREPQYGKLAFDEIISGELEAGVPYLFQAHRNHMAMLYGEDHKDSPVYKDNGMYGTFEQIVLSGDQLDGIYYFAQRALWSCDGALDLTIAANRAYVKLSEIDYLTPNQQNPAPGRRRVTMAVNGEKIATGCENLNVSDKPVKMIINGQLFILRGEKMYDAKGQLVK